MNKKGDWMLIAVFVWIACSLSYILYIAAHLVRSFPS